MSKRRPEIEITEADRERLQRILLAVPAALPEHADGTWLSNWLVSLLSRLPPSFARRDEALRELYERHTGGSDSERRDEVRRLCRVYQSGRWRFDKDRAMCPPDYHGTTDSLLFAIFHCSAGKPPLSDRSLRTILISDCLYKRNTRGKMRLVPRN